MTVLTAEFNSNTAQHNRLLAAILIAAAVHLLLLLIRFAPPEAPKNNQSIDISLSYTATKQAPKEAKFLGSENQLASSDTAPKPQVMPKPDSAGSPQKLSTSSKKIISQPESAAQIAKSADSANIENRPLLSADSLQQQISQIGERYRISQPSAQDSKIKFANAVSTHKYLAAQYVKDWEDKVERTGNLNYPEAARKRGESQTLTMDVGINPDGSIYSMRIVKSSGNPDLDEAAKRIVKISAPFAELPVELLQEVNVLIITRVWKFSDETGMTTR
ncbi:MAG: energy transducer TonB [Methylomonas sp.]